MANTNTINACKMMKIADMASGTSAKPTSSRRDVTFAARSQLNTAPIAMPNPASTTHPAMPLAA